MTRAYRDGVQESDASADPGAYSVKVLFMVRPAMTRHPRLGRPANR